MSFRRGGAGKGSSFQNLPIGLNYSDVGTKENGEKPSIPLPVHNPITSKERAIAVKYINFLNTVKDGPFYTGTMSASVEASDNSKDKPQTVVEDGGFNDGIERYSDKYLKKRRICLSVDTHPFHLEYFPKELYQAMGIKKKKLLALSKFNKIDDLFTGTGCEEEEALPMLEKLKELAENEDEVEENKEKNSSDIEEDLDDDFDDDDDDDYNAEKYFNDGEDDDNGDDDYGDEPAF
ncbi:HBR474Cp [Eremothecium sinecaudum]|uniref:DNA-directed RNA polymerase III subunit n=1 Tax=Eremothecium sinecaudum TaxID=45286 RepID=A0A109UVL6_9SACH|nr:HBR474Cp [Eremothecium sinecaudum]AMD19375.1 HBR474Cp [Eremothecium sinecaudum]